MTAGGRAKDVGWRPSGHPILSIGAAQDPQGRPVGVTTISTHEFNTTGSLGALGDPADGYSIRAFPAWATLPGAQWLAMGRRWHFFFAWIFVVNAATYAKRDLSPQ